MKALVEVAFLVHGGPVAVGVGGEIVGTDTFDVRDGSVQNVDQAGVVVVAVAGRGIPELPRKQEHALLTERIECLSVAHQYPYGRYEELDAFVLRKDLHHVDSYGMPSGYVGS